MYQREFLPYIYSYIYRRRMDGYPSETDAVQWLCLIYMATWSCSARLSCHVESMPHRRDFSHPAQLQLVGRVRLCIFWEDRTVRGGAAVTVSRMRRMAAWREGC